MRLPTTDYSMYGKSPFWKRSPIFEGNASPPGVPTTSSSRLREGLAQSGVKSGERVRIA